MKLPLTLLRCAALTVSRKKKSTHRCCVRQTEIVMFLSTFSSKFPTITKTPQIESADFSAGSVVQGLTAWELRTNKLNKGAFVWKCYFLIAGESYVFHKIGLEEKKPHTCSSS